MNQRDDQRDNFLIKVCGITRLDDALRAVESGANALGFNFYVKSPRYIDPAKAAQIIEELPEDILTVAVVVGLRMVRMDSRDSLAGFQLHGLRDQSEIPEINKRILVATSAQEAHQFPDYEILIDTSWGRGRLGNWEEIGKLRRPFILSGGLTAENVAGAIELLHPAGVDVCSGIERSPGIKDPTRLREFIRNVKRSVGADGVRP